MARRKAPNQPTPIRQSDRKLVLMGDVRQAPIEVRDGDRAFSPVVALWVRADDGYVVGQLIDEPGHPAQTLVQALREPVPLPGQAQIPALPSQVVLFNRDLAEQVQPMLAPLDIEVMVSPPFEPFEELFAELFAHLGGGGQADATLDVPPDALKPLLAAAERLWRARPWEYAFDHPPFGLVLPQADGRRWYASVLGASKDVFGVVLYTSLEDYENTVELGEIGLMPSPAAADETAERILGAIRRRAYLVSFEPKDELGQDYRDQLAGAGWSRRLGVVPTFMAVGGSQEPSLLTAEEAADLAPALDALVAFCRQHRKQIADAEFPIRDSVDVQSQNQTMRVEVAVPPDPDPSAPPATVYRFKVSLAYEKDIWRLIDVRSDQTLEDLHYAIQDAFGWDDDHLYAFFLSGKAWDVSTEYVRPEARDPGDRTARVRLDRLGLRTRKRFLYIFDFGDEWRHDVRVEKSGLAPDGDDYPRIVEEHGEAPPQYGDDDEEEDEEEGEL